MSATVSRRLFWSMTVLSLGLILALGAVLAGYLVLDRPGDAPAAVVERIQLGRADDGTVPTTATSGLTEAEKLSSLFEHAAGRVRSAVVYIQVDLGESAGVWDRPFFNDAPRQSVGSGV
ncbi:MAG: hypothetical protein R3282_05730, partial [Rhodothermales bacterium]|nr:hypothetical protein [Rhodothermales bacterium]